VEFRLLGGIEVRGATGDVNLGPAKQRCVLAALVLHAGRRVATETLIEQVWGQDTHSDVRSSLYSYVARLRRVLRAAGGELNRFGNGYQLDIRPDQVDVHRFTSLVAQAKHREALDEWRGEPLPGLAGPWAERVRTGLRRQYLEALLDWADVQLRADRPGDVVERVGSALHAYQYNEPLIGCYLRGLHMAGRTAEALEFYEASRSQLREELGTRPDSTLRAIHLELLRDDRKQRPVPAQLPSMTCCFTGRAAELAWLDDVAGENVVAISGIGGAGKTALAVTWAHRVTGRFPGGQLHVDLRGYAQPLRPIDALSAFLRALDVTPPSSVEAAAELYQSVLAERPVLVLLDNADSIDQIRPLLPSAGESLTLVTCRHRLHLDSPELVLGSLSRNESVELLATILGSTRAEGAAEVAELCSDFPLALRIAAANLFEYPGYSLTAFAAELREDGPLRVLETPDGAISVRDTFGRSYHRLPQAQQRLFRSLGQDFAANVNEPLMIALADANLVERTGSGQFGFQPLVRSYARAHAD
jgi:DNA-binding SARP family transcriptional activator